MAGSKRHRQNNAPRKAKQTAEDARSNPASSDAHSTIEPETPVSPDLPNHTRNDSESTIVSLEPAHKPLPTTSQSALEIASLLATLKDTTSALAQAMQSFQPLPEKLSDLAGGMRAQDELQSLQEKWKAQVMKQDQEIKDMEERLKQEVIASMRSAIKEKAYEAVRPQIADKVRQRVREELVRGSLSPAEHQAQRHTRIIEETRVLLHNADARRVNSNLESPNALLSPLRLSPSQAIPSPGGVPLPTPVSPRFPTDIKGVLSMKPDEARGLLQEYGLPQAPVRDHEANLNQILSYIGINQYTVHKNVPVGHNGLALRPGAKPQLRLITSKSN
ncbi:hypothetical protein BDN72DRAFT_893486 [Pluteus cervinus]|uniref:Uncharacterized protein n=1 Tax=Pluteus cervinus TaxID=181527 RepID=A0ACD3B8S5_9AGAR|nr:hypothetical protein BDN72DRAFT_893486 [Pluteus cervinus]